MQPGSFNHDCHLYIQNYFMRTMRTWVGSALVAELHYKKTTLQNVNPWSQSALFHFHLTLSNLRQPKPCMHGSHIVTNSAGMYAKGAKLLPHFWPEIWNPRRGNTYNISGFLEENGTLCAPTCVFWVSCGIEGGDGCTHDQQVDLWPTCSKGKPAQTQLLHLGWTNAHGAKAKTPCKPVHQSGHNGAWHTHVYTPNSESSGISKNVLVSRAFFYSNLYKYIRTRNSSAQYMTCMSIGLLFLFSKCMIYTMYMWQNRSFFFQFIVATTLYKVWKL